MLSAVRYGAEYHLLRWISPGEPNVCTGAAYRGKSKLSVLLGPDFVARARGKTVIDFGCGDGGEAIELAQNGASRVIGIDIRENALHTARQRSIEAGVDHICEFVTRTSTQADVILSLDSFEHFADPAAVLVTMAALLRPGGEVLASFGPTWYHPLGGHLFSVFPWAHLIFSETALIRWRAQFKSDGATCFGDTQGGLNQMTIGRFERIVAASPLRFAEMQTVAIRKLRPIHNRWTREFTTALIRCRLVKKY
jgi:SAM-dependent methyltransferase